MDKFYLDLGKHPATYGKRLRGFVKEDRMVRPGYLGKRRRLRHQTIPGSDPYKAMVLLAGGWIRFLAWSLRFVARDAADAEQRIADNVRRLRAHPSLWPTPIETTQVADDGLPSQHQATELGLATAHAVGCFIGGPGTGKTHSLSFLLKQAIEEHGETGVAVCAPTGKAAVRAGESLRSRGLGIHATTIHSLLEIGRNGHDGDGWGFRNCDNPS